MPEPTPPKLPDGWRMWDDMKTEQGYRDASRPWWVVKSRGHAFYGAGTMTTVAPFWRPVHIRNIVSLLRLKWAEWRGY